MATGMPLPLTPRQMTAESSEPTRNQVGLALAIAILFVVATRWPVARVEPFEFDEFFVRLDSRRCTGFPCTIRCS